MRWCNGNWLQKKKIFQENGLNASAYNVARNIWKACLIVYKVILSTHDKIIKAQSIETYYMLKNTLSKEEDLFRYKKKSQMQKGVLKQMLN